MLTTKSKIAEQVLRRLRGYSDEFDIDERELMLSIHQSLASLLRIRFFESKNTESQEVDGSMYYTISDNSVLEDKSRGEFYTKLPSTTISLPFGVEIKRIGPPKGRGFTPVQLGFDSLYSGLASHSLEDHIGYYKEGTSVYFVGMDSTSLPENVSITMVLPLDNLDEDDELNIPADMLDEVIETTFAKYAGTLNIPTDEDNNSVD